MVRRIFKGYSASVVVGLRLVINYDARFEVLSLTIDRKAS